MTDKIHFQRHPVYSQAESARTFVFVPVLKFYLTASGRLKFQTACFYAASQ
ncbi:hypothetical protein l13_13200 [Neisseria weaveri ATCC 51223]|nr:hypothetical protein l13_13200 [Neisseria weaveri ATCC 51223]